MQHCILVRHTLRSRTSAVFLDSWTGLLSAKVAREGALWLSPAVFSSTGMQISLSAADACDAVRLGTKMLRVMIRMRHSSISFMADSCIRESMRAAGWQHRVDHFSLPARRSVFCRTKQRGCSHKSNADRLTGRSARTLCRYPAAPRSP